MLFAKNISKKIGENISKILIAKYSQKLLYYSEQSTTDALKTSSKRTIQEAVEATGDLVVNKVADKIIEVSRSSTQNSSGRINIETDNIEVDKKNLKKYLYEINKYFCK